MAKSIDRRATSPDAAKKEEAAELSQRAQEIKENLDMSRTTHRLRRLGPGSRFIASFFAADKVNLPMRRGEVLGMFEMMAYHQREHRWFRKLWRWLTRTPGPDDTWARLAIVFEERTVKPAIAALEAELKEQKAKEIEKGRAALNAEKEVESL